MQVKRLLVPARASLATHWSRYNRRRAKWCGDRGRVRAGWIWKRVGLATVIWSQGMALCGPIPVNLLIQVLMLSSCRHCQIYSLFLPASDLKIKVETCFNEGHAREVLLSSSGVYKPQPRGQMRLMASLNVTCSMTPLSGPRVSRVILQVCL